MVKQNFLTRTLLLFALIVGSTSVWGQEESGANWSYTVDGDKSKLNTTAKTFTVDEDHVWNYDGTAVGDAVVAVQKSDGVYTLKFGSSKSAYFNPITLTTDAFEDKAITKVSLYLKHNGKKTAKLTVTQGDIEIGTEDIAETSNWITVTGTGTKGEGGTLTIQYEVDQALYINKIEVWYEDITSTDPTSDFKFEDQAPSITFPGTKTYTATYTTADNYNGTISYTLSNNTCGAEIDQTTGKVTVKQEGSVTVKGVAAAVSGSFSASNDSYTLTVVDSRADAGLAYTEATQTIEVGETLIAPTLTKAEGFNGTITFESSDETKVTVDENGNITGVAVGSATITASFEGNDEFKSGSASYTVIVNKAMPAGVLFWESVSGRTEGSTDLTSTLTADIEYLDSDNWNSFEKVYAGKILDNDVNSHLKFGSKDNQGIAVTKSIALSGNGVLTYKVQRYDSSHSGNLTITVEGADADGDVDVTGTDSWVEKTVNLKNAAGNVVITFATTSANTRIRVDDILLVATPTATITDAGYATFSNENALDFSANQALTVYTATDNGTSVKLNEVTTKKVPANTPVVLKGDAGNYPATIISSADALGANDLRISNGSTATAEANIYVLANKTSNGVGFYKWAGTSSLSAGKIYLQAKATSTGAPFLGFDADGETTGISSLTPALSQGEGVYYDLSGRRVAQPTKGLYIVNGKKVLVP